LYRRRLHRYRLGGCGRGRHRLRHAGRRWPSRPDLRRFRGRGGWRRRGGGRRRAGRRPGHGRRRGGRRGGRRRCRWGGNRSGPSAGRNAHRDGRPGLVPLLGVADSDAILYPIDEAGRLRLGLGLRLRCSLRLRRFGDHLLPGPLQEAGAGSAKRVAILVLKSAAGADDHSVGSFPSGEDDAKRSSKSSRLPGLGGACCTPSYPGRFMAFGATWARLTSPVVRACDRP
jgi:hypothetical protein